MSDCALDRVTLAMVSLAANIAANHPKKGLCQLERLRSYGVSAEQIEMVVDIARHLRDEAGQMLDHEFAMASISIPDQPPVSLELANPAGACCSPTAKGNPCC
ncbi:MAG TPA: hypothetical protein DEQ20_03700 [Desulfobulbaceae bacterium]|nr:MAG: hypothetical protein A2520_05790 [Deltaproteobacteria bacterium RIFOXYD12_FULL_53_23]HCC54017.1 hypothetical protein [Desulfobulbaceae bacterium]